MAQAKEDHTGERNPQLWEELVNDYYLGIYQFAFRFLGSKTEAEDVTQETFLAAYQRLEAGAAVEKIKSWLYTIARNRCIDRCRLWRRWRRRLAAIGEREPCAAAEPAVFLRKLLEKLPRRQKEVFILRHWHGFSTLETAEILGINEGTVKSHLIRAVSALKAQIIGEEKATKP